ncbi:MAG: XdhC family protein [Mariniphaga sp.]|nr:XdhC family protein [Mariniphaga sp.]
MEEILSRKNIYAELVECIRKKQLCVLATVTQTWGSAPQVPGSSAIFGENGLITGTVGGGFVEYNIQKEAVQSVQIKKSGYFKFNLNDDISDENAAICGGGMSIFIDASPEKHLSVFESLAESNSKRVPGVLVSLLKSGASGSMDVERFWVTAENSGKVSEKLHIEVAKKIKEILREPKAGNFSVVVEHTSPEFEDNYFLMESVVPLPRLIIAGAGHVGKALTHMGKLLDFEVTVWDDRPEFANKKNLPVADKILCGEMEEALGDIIPGCDTFIVIVTRGHKNDSKVLKHFIHSKAGYIGMMGSRKKVIQLRDHFIEQKWATPEQWDRVHTPIGLPIQSKTVQEIALSIAAELIQKRAQLNKTNG